MTQPTRALAHCFIRCTGGLCYMQSRAPGWNIGHVLYPMRQSGFQKRGRGASRGHTAPETSRNLQNRGSNMTRNQRNRAARRSAPVRGTIPPRNLLNSERNRLASPTIVLPSGQGIRHGRRAGQDKGQDLWRTTSQNYMTAATIDSRWTNHGV